MAGVRRARDQARLGVRRGPRPGQRLQDRSGSYGREHGITVIDGGCLRVRCWGRPSDLGHKTIAATCSA